MSFRTRIYAVLTAMLLLPPAALGDAITAAEQASALLDQAHSRMSRAKTAQNRVIAMTRAIKAYDAAILAARSGLRELRNAEQEAKVGYQKKRANVESILSGLQALGKAPPSITFMHPDGPLGAARAGMTMKDLLPAMNEEADALRAEVERLATLGALQEIIEQELRSAAAALRQSRVDLKQAIFEEREIRGILLEDHDRLARIAKDAQNMREFVTNLRLMPRPPSPADAPEMKLVKGTLPWPTKGKLTRNFREPDAAGISRQGIVMSAPPLSLITAPVTARVRYTGRFLNHGLVVILEPEPDYLLVLSRLGQIMVRAGESIVAGRPIGILGGSDPHDEEFLIELSDAEGAFETESLYIELRHHGIAIDPVPWFLDTM